MNGGEKGGGKEWWIERNEGWRKEGMVERKVEGVEEGGNGG